MKEALLRNPFELPETTGKPVRTIHRSATRTTPVCSDCRSDDIVAHATVQWSNEFAGMGTGKHIQNARALQSMQWRLRRHMAVAELA